MTYGSLLSYVPTENDMKLLRLLELKSRKGRQLKKLYDARLVFMLHLQPQASYRG
jgi:hypothetical protein